MGPGKTAEFVAGCNAGCNGLVIARALVPDSDPSPVVWREPRTRAARAPTPTSQGKPKPSPELPPAVWRPSAALRAQPGATYLTARGLPGPWPVSVRWLSTESARRVGLQPSCQRARPAQSSTASPRRMTAARFTLCKPRR